jgi:hypothetical protein
MLGVLILLAGVICIIISLYTLITNVKESNSIKEKWMAFFDFIVDPFTGLTALFYLGLLLMLFGLLSISNIV